MVRPIVVEGRSACRCSPSVAPSTSSRCDLAKLLHCASRGSQPRRLLTVRAQASKHNKPRGPSSLAAAIACSPFPCTARASFRQADSAGGAKWDVVGLGQAMVDFTASVDESMLSSVPFSVQKGSRRVVTLEERAAVIESLDAADCPSEVSPGGSLANTLVAVSRLATARGGADVSVSMGGCLGTDALGQYFNAQLGQAGVRVLANDDAISHTGTVMVLSTPDAHRSFLSFFSSDAPTLTPRMRQAITSARMVVIEGYMLELPNSAAWAQEVITLARASGAQVALTAGDPGVVQRHRATIRQLIDRGLDIVFANADEARHLVCLPEGDCNAREAAAKLGSLVPVAVVTDGSRGSYISALGDIHQVPVHTSPDGVVDVCGAGDAYAAGTIFCLLQGYDLQTAGQFASRVASAVVRRHGAQLSDEDAKGLVAGLPDHLRLPMQVRRSRKVQQ